MSKTITLYRCDGCNNIITNPVGGLVVHGNIYVADPESEGGLIGNNFPTDAGNCDFPDIKNVVKKSVYCIPCFLNATIPDYKLSTTR